MLGMTPASSPITGCKNTNPPRQLGGLIFGIFRRGNKSPVESGKTKDFSNDKSGELKAAAKKI